MCQTDKSCEGQSGILKMKEWLIDETWEPVFKADSAHKKAEIFQQMLMSKLDEIFPIKTQKIQSDDQPWITQKLKRRKRIYRK